MSKHGFMKTKRQKILSERLKQDPFLTDEVLSTEFSVSVPTIRLDRLELKIPELRERIKHVASENYRKVKSLGTNEIIGELIDISLNNKAISILETTQEMAFEKTNIVRGHYVYSLAESLAISLIDADVALVGVANIKYKVPVYANTRIIAKAEVKKIREKNFVVWVKIYDKKVEVFRGKFILVAPKNSQQNYGGKT